MQNNFSYFWISNQDTLKPWHENLTVLKLNRFLKMTSRNSRGYLGALCYPAPECDYLGFDGPVGAEQTDKWRDDVMICPRAVFADLWNVLPFAACGMAPFSGCLPSVWRLELTSPGDPLGHKWLIAAFEAWAEPSVWCSELAHVRIFPSLKGAVWFLMVPALNECCTGW